MHLPSLISDLALMLITAAIVTILFKRIKQPLVLGYIVAGFLTGPYITFIPSVVDTASVSTWSEIGIIILMFYLGLEFNLHKLAQVGGTAIITALVEVAGMLALGFAVGQLLGWSTMNSVFLGGMLSMSSTTIIIKAFDEMSLRGRRFTELVFGTLVIEDIAGIFMMIILSTIAVSQNISGGELALNILMLLLYLVVWLLLGIFLLPTVLNRTSSLMNDETLLIFSLGICFGMVLLANTLGFSSALGAFLAGSLLAGTVHAERVEHLTKGVRDLFGAVFFISVGMMVDPAMLVAYIGPIILISLVTIVGKLIFSSGGVLLSGQPLSTALHCGFSLAQIGEFAFIIASLGLSLSVTADFLYPIVVSVSVITTFTTPFCIKAADPVTNWAESHLPSRIAAYLNRYTDENQSEKEHDNDWQAYIKRYFFTLALYGALLFAIYLGATELLAPWLQERLPGGLAKALTLLAAYACMAIFIRPLLDLRNSNFTALWLKSRSFRLPLIALTVLRVALIVLLLMLPMQRILGVGALWLLPAVVLVVWLLSRSKLFASSYLQVEARFLANFNERLLHREAGSAGESDWLDEKLFLVRYTVPEGSPFAGQTLQELNWGRSFSAYVVKIIRGRNHINIPPGRERLQEGDSVLLLGEAKPIENICRLLGFLPERPLQTLRSYINSQEEDAARQLYCVAFRVERDSPLSHSSIRDSGIREQLGGFLLGLQRGRLPLIRPDINMLLMPDDFIWVLGTRQMANLLAQRGLLDMGEQENAPQAADPANA